jgi:hypothetical protein
MMNAITPRTRIHAAGHDAGGRRNDVSEARMEAAYQRKTILSVRQFFGRTGKLWISPALDLPARHH